MILRAYRQWGEGCLERLRGMFSFALWDEETQTLFAARDRFGIKPFYYTVVDDVLYFASEVKALLPFLPEVETDLDGFADYLTFQFPLAGKTLFKGVSELLPGHFLRVRNGDGRDASLLGGLLRAGLRPHGRTSRAARRSCSPTRSRLHLRADVPVGAYLSGGLDSSIIASLASTTPARDCWASPAVSRVPGYDESRYARSVADERGFELHEIDDRRRATSSSESARSSTTSTTRSPGPARSRSTWSPSWRPSTGKSCSAGRAATRSSVAMCAT